MLNHNRKMKDFLAGHGIECIPKRIDAGSLRGTWRLYGKGQSWTQELQDRLNFIGFRDFDGELFGRYSGNGGIFSVFARIPERIREFVE